jgi:hypothetical protein
MFRFKSDTDGTLFPIRAEWQEWYVPVEWLTDNTPLREPLLHWAGLWGEYVEEDFRFRSDRRIRGEDPYNHGGRGGGFGDGSGGFDSSGDGGGFF